MEIYIRVREDGCGKTAWFNEEDGWCYLMDGTDIWDSAGEYLRGTPFKNAQKARAAAKQAKSQMEWDGAMGKVTASFWRFVRGKLVETKFDKDGKIIEPKFPKRHHLDMM